MAYVIICLTENNNKKGNKMSLGLLGQKLGMTRIFADDGSSTSWPTSTDYDFFVTIDAGTAQEERVL